MTEIRHYFGIWNGTFFHNIYPSEAQCRLCGCNSDIRKVEVREAGENEKPTHWGWQYADEDLWGKTS